MQEKSGIGDSPTPPLAGLRRQAERDALVEFDFRDFDTASFGLHAPLRDPRRQQSVGFAPVRITATTI